MSVPSNICGSPRPSLRSNIESFKVMDVAARATELEKEGRSICHMEVGQPSTGAPSLVLKAARDILDKNILGYTAAMGISDLREKIAEHYHTKYGAVISSDRVVVTTGSSAGFCMAFLGFFDVGQSVALCSSGYPCYRNIMKATGLHSVNIPVNQEFKVTSVELDTEIQRRKVAGESCLSGLILSSPGNPTGAMLTPSELEKLCHTCKENGILFLSDEIYHGISFGSDGKKREEASAVQFCDNAVVINSFSKYFSMTGWRLGENITAHYHILHQMGFIYKIHHLELKIHSVQWPRICTS
jgi:aspartate/methionine/tyrosine aminotransferase